MGLIHLDNTYYFITCSTFDRYPYFDTPDKKQIIIKQLRKTKERLIVKLYAYSISDSHLHALWFVKSAADLPKIAQYLQGGSAFVINRLLKREGRVWGKYYEIAIENKLVLQRVYGYIIGNILKHREVKNFDELLSCPFSSFSQAVRKYGFTDMVKLVTDVIRLDYQKIFLAD